MGSITKKTDFSPLELPMQRPEWNGNLMRSHPLCDMPFDFIKETLELNRRNNSKLFVAHDERANLEGFRKYGAVFSSVLASDTIDTGYEMKFVDMLTAMHSEFFILNPRSTFSWQIYIIRQLLMLTSVPVIQNDLYVQPHSEIARYNRTLWVSWQSVVDVLSASTLP